MESLAIWPQAALAVGVLIQLILGRVLSRPAKGWLAFACGLAAFGASLAMVPSVAQGHNLTATPITWDGWPVSIQIDGLSMVFMLMATGIGSAILLYCTRYMAHEEEGTTRFYALMLTFIFGLVSLVVSSHLLMVYFSWEIIGLCSYFLVGFWYKQTAAANGARKVLVMTHIPGYGLLLAILLIYTRTGTFVWTDPAVASAFTTGIFLLMLVAAMAKSVMFPLHTWIPEAMNAPTPVSALLHSACYVKAGIYLVARMYSYSGAAHWPQSWNLLVMALGCATMLVGAWFALVETDLKRLLAFSTISQLGNIIAALGLGTSLGVAAGLFYTFSHGLFKGTLFLCAGAVQHATGTRDMRRLGGLAAQMPATARIWLIAAASIVGVPLLNGFVAKWLLFSAGLQAGSAGSIVVAVAWLTSLFTAFYMLKATSSVFFGELPPDLAGRPIHDAAPAMQAGMGTLAAACIFFGIAPQVLMNWIVAPAARSLGFALSANLTWLGFQSGNASLQTTAAAGVVLLALLAGWVVYQVAGTAGRRPVQTGSGFGSTLVPAPVGVFTGGEPRPAGDVVTAVDFADLANTAFQPVYAVTDPDPLYFAIWKGISRLATGLGDWLQAGTTKPVLLGLLVTAAIVLLALLKV